ncbi:ferredoxin [Williamsia sp.]|uniref:ferredoxin n=1 Tax=Williamsia sp. TaxID=1872085 RepID=UPI002F938273
MKVTVEQSKCIAAGQCVFEAAEVFDQRDDDGIVQLIDDHPPAELHAHVREAASVCPAMAIHVEE